MESEGGCRGAVRGTKKGEARMSSVNDNIEQSKSLNRLEAAVGGERSLCGKELLVSAMLFLILGQKCSPCHLNQGGSPYIEDFSIYIVFGL